MARVGLDLDGVCYKFVDALRFYIYESTGRALDEMPPATRWEFYEDWGYSLAEYKQIVAAGVKDSDLFWRGQMYDGCKEAVDYLYHIRQDHIVLITSRFTPAQPKLAYEATYYWVNNVAGLPYNDLILSDDKFGYGFDVLFDDAPYQFEKNKKSGENNMVVFDQPWNWHLTDAPRVYGWTGLLNYVEEKFPVA